MESQEKKPETGSSFRCDRCDVALLDHEETVRPVGKTTGRFCDDCYKKFAKKGYGFKVG
jgi:hypothetical protein